jgi:hypothetical protein
MENVGQNELEIEADSLDDALNAPTTKNQTLKDLLFVSRRASRNLRYSTLATRFRIQPTHLGSCMMAMWC